MERLSLVALVAIALSVSGCVSTGSFNTVNETQVQLARDNYRIVATNVSGEADAGYLFGFSASGRERPTTVALFRVDGEPMLMKQALENLWANFEDQHGTVVEFIGTY
jgi:hypothetical protein